MTIDLALQARLEAREAVNRDAVDEAIEILSKLAVEYPTVMIDLAPLYLRRSEWQRAADAARIGLTLKCVVDTVFQLQLIIIFALRQLEAFEQLRADCGPFQDRLQAVIADTQPVVRLESIVGLKYWQMFLLVAFGCGDEARALKIFRMRDPRNCPVAANATSVCSSPVTDLKTWCDAAGARYEVIEPANRIKLASNSAEPAFWEYKTEAFILAAIPEAECLSGWDFVRTSTGEVLSDSGYTPVDMGFLDFIPHVYLTALGFVGHIWAEHSERIDEDALFLSTPERFHVGHWIVDFLPRLRALEKFPDQDLKLVIPTQLSTKQMDLLELFGIPSSRLIQCDLGKRYTFRTLFVVRPGGGTRPNPDNVRFVAKALRLPPSPVKRPSRLFIERAVGTRNIMNQPALDLELSKFGFEIVNLSKMSVAEQRQRFNDAEIVIGIYGSDVLACYFMQPGSDLIELKWDASLDAATGPYCSILGLNYHTLLCPEATSTKIKRQKKDRDFNVDCESLGRLLESIIARKALQP